MRLLTNETYLINALSYKESISNLCWRKLIDIWLLNLRL